MKNVFFSVLLGIVFLSVNDVSANCNSVEARVAWEAAIKSKCLGAVANVKECRDCTNDADLKKAYSKFNFKDTGCRNAYNLVMNQAKKQCHEVFNANKGKLDSIKISNLSFKDVESLPFIIKGTLKFTVSGDPSKANVFVISWHGSPNLSPMGSIEGKAGDLNFELHEKVPSGVSKFSIALKQSSAQPVVLGTFDFVDDTGLHKGAASAATSLGSVSSMSALSAAPSAANGASATHAAGSGEGASPGSGGATGNTPGGGN